MTEKLKNLTLRYIEATETLIAGRKFGEGLFGMPDSARSSPVHVDYYNAVEAAVKELAGEKPDAETADELARFLLKACHDYPSNTLAQWMIIAIQNHALPIIPYMSPAAKAELAAWYNEAFPRLQRLPNQDKIAKALKK